MTDHPEASPKIDRSDVDRDPDGREWWPIDKPIPYARNPRQIPDAAIQKVAGAIREFGFRQPVVVDRDGVIVVGHTRLEAARRAGFSQVWVHVAHDLTPEQAKAYRLADNRLGQETSWDTELLGLELQELQGLGVDLDMTGFDTGEIGDLIGPDDGDGDGSGDGSGNGEDEGKRASLADRFGVPPFTVLNAREGWWQDRKRAWIDLGIRSELGRGENLTEMSESTDEYRYNRDGYGEQAEGKKAKGKKADTRAIKDHDWQRENLGKVQAKDTSNGS